MKSEIVKCLGALFSVFLLHVNLVARCLDRSRLSVAQDRRSAAERMAIDKRRRQAPVPDG